MRFCIIFIVLLISTGGAFSKTILVPWDYSTIQEAIFQAVDGETILVYPGTYYGCADFNGKAITIKSREGPELTVLDGEQGGYFVVYAGNGERYETVLDGFTISNGSNSGGIGLFDASPILRNNIIANNLAFGLERGGGITLDGHSAPIIMNNLIIENVASDLFSSLGGGIRCKGNLLLQGGTSNKGRTFILLGSVSGNAPGIPLPGGGFILRVNWDLFTLIVLNLINTPFFDNFYGSLDNNGMAYAVFETNIPFPSNLIGETVYFAYACNDPWSFVSNPLGINIVP